MKGPKLRIVQAIASKGWGGRESVPLLLAGEFRRRGHEVVLWVDPKTRMGMEAETMGFPVSPLGHRSHLDPRGFFEVRQAMAKDRPDILHVHLSRDLWRLVPVLKASGWKGPLVLSKHVESAVLKKDPFHGFLYDRVDLVLACSSMVQHNVLNTCPMEPGKVRVGHPPVDTAKFRPNPSGRRRTRRAWGLGKEPVVGMVARLSPGKGHELVLRTAALLTREFPKLRFKMAGGASPEEVRYAKELGSLRDSLGLQGRFDFEGYVKDIPSFLGALDLAVHAAPNESFGMAIVEAMACGTPVLARKGGGVADIFQGPKGSLGGGKMIGSDDPKIWAKEIGRLLRVPAALRSLGRECRKNAQRFALEKVADLHLGWYYKLLEKR